MENTPFFCYRSHMKDYMEIMDFCGYDLDRATEIASVYRAAVEEEMNRVGLEAIQSESRRPDSRGLHNQVDMRSDRA